MIWFTSYYQLNRDLGTTSGYVLKDLSEKAQEAGGEVQ